MKKNCEDDQFYESVNKTDLRNHTENDDLYIGFSYINIHLMDLGIPQCLTCAASYLF